MAIDRDRIALIKRIHQGFQKPAVVKVRKVYVARPTDPEAFKEYRRGVDRNYKKMKKERGECRCCPSQAVSIFYVFDGKILMESTSKHCPNHWDNPNTKEKLLALLVPAQSV